VLCIKIYIHTKENREKEKSTLAEISCKLTKNPEKIKEKSFFLISFFEKKFSRKVSLQNQKPNSKGVRKINIIYL